MTRVKACEEKTPDRSSSIFASFSNPRASTNRNSEGQELHFYFERKLPVQPILSMNKSSCNFKQKAIWQLAPKTSAAKKPLLLGGAGHQSQDSNFMPRAHRWAGNVHNNAILAPLKKGYIFSLIVGLCN